MATLTANVSPSTNPLPASGPVPNGFYTIDDEAIYVHGHGAPKPLLDPTSDLNVTRGIAGTTAASHSSGATLTRYYPDAASGEGGAIAATDTQVVFMDGTDAVGSDNLTWDDTGNVLGITAVENGTATVEANALGAQLLVKAANGDADHIGGELTLQSGDSAGQGAGQLNIQSGLDSGGGDGGPIVIYSGSATDGESGTIDIRVGASGNSATGGDINIQAGQGQTGSGGHLSLAAGPRMSGGSHGSVFIDSGGFGTRLRISDTEGFVVTAGIVVIDGLPSADPEVEGQIYTDGVVSAGVPQALMVSGGPA